MRRRNFIKNAGLLAGGLAFLDHEALAAGTGKTNPLPKWKGFNLLDFFSPNPAPYGHPTIEDHILWMRDWGFDYVRIPMAYPHYLQFDRSRDITTDEVYHIDEQKVQEVDQLVTMANKHGLHVSLNLHRAPGYCVNAGFHEPYNLWKDQAALDAYCYHWNFWAHRYRGIPKDKISFDLLNEPAMRADMNDQHSAGTAVPGDVYRKVMGAATEAIRKESPERLIIAEGNWGGNLVVPELEDLGIAQSCRGYNPHQISHYKAPWANKDPEHCPVPLWPGQVGNQYLSRDMLVKYYQPWIKLVEQGVGVHCGECGCWNKTPHDVFIAWFSDVLDILSAGGIGFALWNFIGDFGILDSGRTDVAYEDWHGHQLDRQLLQLLQKH
ncbi:glycoside hydrolase family 5 protein [Dinghuibacter silviterrae]|uniref:Aryl-phospho-beta-D-glucosidase BglC (GH1 family) n=1 Tax=Dinghuibacter silviterrae TaxID=1539049 RepID=A0A4R8DPR1_9BACT|nr:cellulase family glycosylhydrolase [Dinghuibacter silviterrae]TDW99110.1 aryl-phospho-beta-D-glucosidase BglC (GH1 family) [Dinghuibacter silviterrae]